MKHIVAALTLICSFTYPCQAQKNNFAEKETLQNVVDGFFEGIGELNVEKVKSFCASDITILENGKVWNFDSLAFRITTRKAKSADFKRVNQLNFIETKYSGDVAWLYYRNQATITASGKTVVVKWLESVVLKKEKTGWKISLLHSTELERMDTL